MTEITLSPKYSQDRYLADGQLGTSEASLYTVGTRKYAKILSIILTNTHSSAITVRIFVKPTGGTSRQIAAQDLSLAAGENVVLEYPFALSAGDAIRGLASTAAKVDYYISGSEEIGR